MQIDAERRITRFVEKPAERAVQDSLRLPPEWYSKLGIKGNGELFLASMGIYIFNRDVIRRLLDNTLPDFGKRYYSTGDPKASGVLLGFPRVLGGHWHDPRVFRGQH